MRTIFTCTFLLLLSCTAARASQAAERNQDEKAKAAGTGSGEPVGKIPEAEEARGSTDRVGRLAIEDLSVLREALLDPQALPDQRRRWAYLLVRFEGRPAQSLLIDLLSGDVPYDVILSLLESMHDFALDSDDGIDPAFGPSLITLLGSDEQALRDEASHLLAMVTDEGVASQLAEVVRQESLPLHHRLAAVDALAPNIYDRNVLGALIHCLDVKSMDVRKLVLEALEPASRDNIGTDIQAWKAWWDEASRHSDQRLLADQSRFYRRRSKRLEEQFEAYRDNMQEELSVIESKMAMFQRELLRTAKGEARRQRLVEWLGDDLPAVVRTALGIIKADMADDGVQPDESMVAALLALLDARNAVIRREALQIVQKVRDKRVLDEVLSQLEYEDDADMRLAFLKAIRELNFKEALPALLEELSSKNATEECIREASFAIDRIAANADLIESDFAIVAALEDRYSSTPSDKVAVRGALLSAMAGVGHKAFLSEFVDAVDASETAIVRPAIRGLARLGHNDKRERLREHIAHPDPLVRLEAITAIRKLTVCEEDLPPLLTRINPTVEDNALTRDSAWEAILEVLSARPFDGQIEGATLLANLPDREITYLEGLTAGTPAPNDPRLDSIWSRLADLSLERKDIVGTCRFLRSLYRHRIASGHEDSLAPCLRWLRLTLERFPDAEPGEVMATLLEGDHSVEEWDRVIALIREYAESEDIISKPDRARQLHAKLESIVSEKLPPAWAELLQQWNDRIAQREGKNVQSTNGNG